MEGKESHRKEGFIITPVIFSSVAHDGENFSKGLHSHGGVFVISFTSHSYESYIQEEKGRFFKDFHFIDSPFFQSCFCL